MVATLIESFSQGPIEQAEDLIGQRTYSQEQVQRALETAWPKSSLKMEELLRILTVVARTYHTISYDALVLNPTPQMNAIERIYIVRAHPDCVSQRTKQQAYEKAICRAVDGYYHYAGDQDERGIAVQRGKKTRLEERLKDALSKKRSYWKGLSLESDYDRAQGVLIREGAHYLSPRRLLKAIAEACPIDQDHLFQLFKVIDAIIPAGANFDRFLNYGVIDKEDAPFGWKCCRAFERRFNKRTTERIGGRVFAHFLREGCLKKARQALEVIPYRKAIRYLANEDLARLKGPVLRQALEALLETP